MLGRKSEEIADTSDQNGKNRAPIKEGKGDKDRERMEQPQVEVSLSKKKKKHKG